jgi:protein SCO1/2
MNARIVVTASFGTAYLPTWRPVAGQIGQGVVSLDVSLANGVLPFASAPDTAAGDGSTRLAVIDDAADFSLVDQDGQTLRFSDLRGKVVLVSFIFTTCSGTCPATTHRMGQVQQELKSRGLLDGRVQLVSITLDPRRDTPEVLRGYMRLYDADPASWRFLTGPLDEVQQVIESWGMWARPAANGQLNHPSRIFLVDTRQRIREIYNLAFLKTPWVADDVELLLHEANKTGDDGQ